MPGYPLVPAKAATQSFAKNWMPAVAGMSGVLLQRERSKIRRILRGYASLDAA